QYLYCHGIISGYADGTFRPYNNMTRAQATKLVVLGFDIPRYVPRNPTFWDVPPDHPFFVYVESLWHDLMSRGGVIGYPDGSFRPDNWVTRGQFCKIVWSAACWPIDTTGGPHFSDVPVGSTFYAH